MNNKKMYGDVIGHFFLLSIMLLASAAIPGASAGLYEVNIDGGDLPTGILTNFEVIFTLPAGLIYNTGSSTVNGASLEPVVGGNNNGFAPVTLTWSFAQVDNSGGNAIIIIQFDGIVANVISNQDGVQLPPGTVSYTYDGITSLKIGKSQPTNIIEPDLMIEKRRISDNGNFITFELSVYHTSKSTSTAFDVKLTDVIPQSMNYKTGNTPLTITHGPPGATNDDFDPILYCDFPEI